MKKNKKAAKLIIAGILSMLMLMSTGMRPVLATSSATGVDILFYVPDDWTTHYNGPKIHLWNAGSYTTSWPGTEMTFVKPGVYRYTNFNLNSCDFVINDGFGNSQTADLHTNGKVTVKDGNIINRSQHPTQIRFVKPSTWGDNIKIYYYSADSSATKIYSWPGMDMEKEDVFHYYGAKIYNYEITEFESCRVIFTDGVNQYPAANQPGILVNAGNTYYITSTGTVNSQDYYSTTVTVSTNQVAVGQEFKVVLDTENDYARYISDHNNGMEIVDETVVSTENGRIVKEYTVKFTTAGTKEIYAYYSYLGAGTYLGKSVKIKVYDLDSSNEVSARWGDVYYIDNATPEVILGEQCIIYPAMIYPGKMNVVLVTEDGEILDTSYIYDSNTSKTGYSFTINRYCKNMKVYVYTHFSYTPYSWSYAGYFTVTVK